MWVLETKTWILWKSDRLLPNHISGFLLGGGLYMLILRPEKTSDPLELERCCGSPDLSAWTELWSSAGLACHLNH